MCGIAKSVRAMYDDSCHEHLVARRQRSPKVKEETAACDTAEVLQHGHAFRKRSMSELISRIAKRVRVGKKKEPGATPTRWFSDMSNQDQTI